MSNYHITQEQAVVVVKDCDHSIIVTGSGNLYQFTECQLKAFTNAALDKVLGEPVAITLVSDPYDERDGLWFDLDDIKNLKALPAGTKLYAPKKLP